MFILCYYVIISYLQALRLGVVGSWAVFILFHNHLNSQILL